MAATTARKEIDLVVVDLGRQQDMMVLKLSQLVGILEQHALDELIDCILRVVDELLGRSHDWIVAFAEIEMQDSAKGDDVAVEGGGNRQTAAAPGTRPPVRRAVGHIDTCTPRLVVVRAYIRRVSHKVVTHSQRNG